MENKNTVKKELKEISPFLANLEKGNGFKVPEAYFDQLHEQMMTEVREDSDQKELDKIFPFLSKLDKKNSFKVPEGYFEQLQEKVMVEVQQETKQEKEKTTAKRVSLSRYRTFQIAASVAAILAVLFLLPNKANTTDPLAEITDEEAVYYLAQNLEDLDEELFLEFSVIEEDEALLPQDLNGELLDEILEEYMDELGDDDFEGIL